MNQAELLKTSLYEQHLALKAKMAPFAGFDMPVQYTSVKDEVLAVRQKIGVFDVSHMGEFFVTGPEAVKFIDEMITNDFQNAEIGKAVYSPLCRQDGTIIDDLIAYKLQEEKILVCVNASNIQKDWEWLNQFSKNYNCSFENKSNDYSLLAIQGPESETIMRKLDLLPSQEIAYYAALEFQDTIIARTGYTGEDGFEIFGTHEKIQQVWNQLMELGVTPCGLAARDVLRLEVCFPLYGHELSDEITPLDAGLKWTVKTEKPQFIGKEALSSQSANYRMAKLVLDKGIPREGYSVLNEQGEVIGKITSGTMSVMLNKGIAMALIEKNKWPKNDSFMVLIRQNQWNAQHTAKAFYRRN